MCRTQQGSTMCDVKHNELLARVTATCPMLVYFRLLILHLLFKVDFTDGTKNTKCEIFILLHLWEFCFNFTVVLTVDCSELINQCNSVYSAFSTQCQCPVVVPSTQRASSLLKSVQKDIYLLSVTTAHPARWLGIIRYYRFFKIMYAEYWMQAGR